MGATRHRLSLHAAPSGAQCSERDLRSISDEVLRRLLDEARAAGLAEGREQSRESGRDALEAAAMRLDEERERAVEHLPGQVVELATEIAGQLLRIAIDAGTYDLERMVRSALDAADVGRGEAVVHLHPEDVARLGDVPFRAGTRLQADPEMVPGDVHVTTPKGLLVRELGPTLDAIREQLLEEFA